jgi:hypothetical protein
VRPERLLNVTLTKPAVAVGVTAAAYFTAEILSLFRPVPDGILAIAGFSAFLAVSSWVGLTIKWAVTSCVSDAIKSALTTHTMTRALSGIEGAAASAATGRTAAASKRLTLVVTDQEGTAIRPQASTPQDRQSARAELTVPGAHAGE